MEPTTPLNDQNLAASSNSQNSPFVSSFIKSISTRKEIEKESRERWPLRYLQERKLRLELCRALMGERRLQKLVTTEEMSVLGQLHVKQKLAEVQERGRKAQEAIDIACRENQVLKAKLVNLENRLSRYIVDLVLEWKRCKEED